MTRVHIIGVGSPFGDDQLGWRAAEALRRAVVELGAENTVHVMQCATPGGELVDALCEADAA
ncbi:MAG: hydrogenase, partial [Gammaproteobacteria bacterium]|nr:hydrogenase [Gammaproteobacteria bacterium]